MCRSQSQYVELQIVDNVDTDLAPEISCWLRLGEGAGIYSITLEAVIEHHKDDPIKYQQRCRAVRGSQPSCPPRCGLVMLPTLCGYDVMRPGEEERRMELSGQICACVWSICVWRHARIAFFEAFLLANKRGNRAGGGRGGAAGEQTCKLSSSATTQTSNNQIHNN